MSLIPAAQSHFLIDFFANVAAGHNKRDVGEPSANGFLYPNLKECGIPPMNEHSWATSNATNLLQALLEEVRDARKNGVTMLAGGIPKLRRKD